MFLSDNHLIRFILWGVLIISAVYGLLYVILSRAGKDPRNILPIDFANRIRIPLILLLVAALGKTAFTSGLFRIRSEERRVGKECRSRWEAEHYRQKDDTGKHKCNEWE